MTTIVMAKRGIGTVTLTQTTDGMVDITTVEGLTFTVDKDGGNALYLELLGKGFTVKPQKEPKVAAPKEPKVEKTPKTREQSLTEKYGDKEARKAYVEAKKRFTREVVDSLTKWQKDHRRLTLAEYADQRNKGVKQMLKAWEDNGRPALA